MPGSEVPVAHHPLPTIGQLLVPERRQVLLELRRDRGLDQPPRPGPQKLREGVRNPCSLIPYGSEPERVRVNQPVVGIRPITKVGRAV